MTEAALEVRNDGDAEVSLNPYLDGLIWVDGKRTRLSAEGIPQSDFQSLQNIMPGDCACLTVRVLPLLHYLRDYTGVIEVSVQIQGRLFLKKRGTEEYETVRFKTEAASMWLDYAGIENVASPDGPSEFFVINNEVYYAGRSLIGGGKSTLSPLKLQADQIRALNPRIVCDARSLYWTNLRQKRPVRETLRGMGRVFYGDDQEIWTTYGVAKVSDPQSFEAFLPAGPSMYSSGLHGYQCGYGRDAQHAYYFDESTSTKHASVIRACKNPKELESLGGVYARDKKHVYAEGKIMKGADVASFERLNAVFARDKSGIWCHGDLVIKAEDLEEPVELLRQDRSDWGQHSFEASEVLRVGAKVFDADIVLEEPWRDLRDEDLSKS
ncbi:DKNYY domain-containing protein [Halocynthiibacter sp.]|uniref:DKNYY domain-containing protein n=1 Tax=Halocynthiibacter sp. TaxID=1979210 RepID=UPI003C5CF6BC